MIFVYGDEEIGYLKKKDKAPSNYLKNTDGGTRPMVR